MSIKRTNQDGFVSLFTAIIISLLLLVITMSLITLETLQLRKAQDAEQTLRAYYAAEAGVEDAVSKVLSNPTDRTDRGCSANSNYDIPGAAGWTCQKITFSGTPFGKLETPDVAKTIDPGNVNYQSILLEWDQSTTSNAARFNPQLPNGFLSQATYTANYSAAPLELSIVEYPTGGFRASEVGSLVKLQNLVVIPGFGTGLSNYATIRTNNPFRGNCAPNRTVGFGGRPTSYNCYAVISGFTGGNDFLFRLRSKYLPSAYKMTFFTGNGASGNVVNIPDGTATIDVTAKAGQTYRRVISKLPLGSSASAGLNYVIYSDGDVCKNFSVFDNVPQPGCPY